MVSERPLVWLARLLERLRIPYAVIGAHAVNTWIEPRFTADIDVTVELTSASTRELSSALEREGFALARAHGAQLPSGPDFLRFTSRDRLVTVELQQTKTALQRRVIERARRDRDGVSVATPEDLLVLKLIADRPKDQVDLLGLASRDGLDWAYIEEAAREWDLGERLAALRGRATS